MHNNNHINFEVARWAGNIVPSAMQKMLAVANKPNLISFALGFPDAKLFPIDIYQKCIDDAIKSTHNVLQYSTPLETLKSHIVQIMALRNVKCKESQIFLTSGAQQATSILAKLFLNQHATVAAESLTYPGFLQIVAPFCPNIISIPITAQDGICLSSLEKAFSNKTNKPAFFYCVPQGQNPLGITLNEEQKRRMAELSRSYQVPIIEDDAYGFLSYESHASPIRSYEDEYVIYVGTFSKTIAPSFRVGWIIVHESLIDKLAYIKEGSDINMASFGQIIVNNILDSFPYKECVSKLSSIYRERRNAMVSAITNYFPKNVKLTVPDSGFFIWVEFPETTNTSTLLENALSKNVAYMPSEIFSCNPKDKKYNGMRLNFSCCDLPLINQGIKVLGTLI